MTTEPTITCADGNTYHLTRTGWRDPAGHPVSLATVFGACADDNDLRAKARRLHVDMLRDVLGVGLCGETPLLDDLVKMADVVFGPEVAEVLGWEGGARRVANRLYEGGIPQPAYRGGPRNRAWTRTQIIEYGAEL